MTTNDELVSLWRASNKTKTDYWRDHLQGEMTLSAFIGRTWRAEQKLAARPELFRVDLGKPWTLPHGDYVIVGDVQIPSTSYDFAALPMAVAREYLPKGRRHLVIAGDLVNADAFSTYENDVEGVAFSREMDAARQFLDEYLTVFDRIWITIGNHERRVSRRTRLAISPALLLKMMAHSPRVEISNWGHCVVENDRGYPWRVTHARNYSINQLTVADQLALKYQQNIIQHHEHHLAKGFDRYGRYVVINGGGLFNPAEMAYAVLDDSKSAAMVQGFTVLRNGVGEIYGPQGFTDWTAVLPERKKVIPLRAA